MFYNFKAKLAFILNYYFNECIILSFKITDICYIFLTLLKNNPKLGSSALIVEFYGNIIILKITIWFMYALTLYKKLFIICSYAELCANNVTLHINFYKSFFKLINNYLFFISRY